VSDIQPKSFNLRNTHQKSNRQTLFFYSETVLPSGMYIYQFDKFEKFCIFSKCLVYTKILAYI